MNKAYRLVIVMLIGILVAGCAGGEVKPKAIICTVLGGTAGAGIVAGALDEGDDDAIAGGVMLGMALGYFLCQDRSEPEPPAPTPAPRPAPPPPPPEVEVGETLVSLEGVNFALNSAKIMSDSEGILNKAVDALNQHASVHVRVEGHTDSRGTAAYNKTLSEERGSAVVAYLVGKGIDADRLSAIGYGEAAPVVPNDTEENMYKNRRVDLVVTKN